MAWWSSSFGCSRKKRIIKMKKSENYSDEFDKLVETYINQLFFGTNEENSLGTPYYIFYEQFDSVEMAAVCSIFGRSLDSLIENNYSLNKTSPEEINYGKQLAERVYNHFKDVYITQAILNLSDSE